MFPDHGFGPPPFFKIVFYGIFALVVFRIVTSLFTRATLQAANQSAPLRSSDATVVAKRSDLRGGRKSARTRYFITFELSDGARLELAVTGEQFGQWIERDSGILRFQGTWFQGFERRTNELPPVAAGQREASRCAHCATVLPPDEVECPNCGSAQRAET
jgi:hypothetical protein